MATTSPLRQRMIEDMTIRNLSQATQQSYINEVINTAATLENRRTGSASGTCARLLHLIAQKRSCLPPVLSPEEIARFLEAVVGLRNRVALTTPTQRGSASERFAV
jgi:integrase/recombinase XerD